MTARAVASSGRRSSERGIAPRPMAVTLLPELPNLHWFFTRLYLDVPVWRSSSAVPMPVGFLRGQRKPVLFDDLVEMVRFFFQQLGGIGRHRGDLDAHAFGLQVPHQFNIVGVAGHDDDRIHLVGHLDSIDRQGNVRALMTRPDGAVIVIMQALLQLLRDLPALAEIHQPAQAAIHQQAWNQHVEIEHGIGVLGLGMDAALDIVAIDQDGHRLQDLDSGAVLRFFGVFHGCL